MFGGLYDGCHVNCLSLGLFFNPANHPRVDPQGLVMYGDCGEGSTYGIFLENNFIVGHVDGLVVFHENAVSARNIPILILCAVIFTAMCI